MMTKTLTIFVEVAQITTFIVTASISLKFNTDQVLHSPSLQVMLNHLKTEEFHMIVTENNQNIHN